ncbi:MAG: GTPase ObgE, partial [Pseudomonadota bacterium]|nr:GTPase ObgE [Pseudomonadota bacterium]
EGTEVLCLDLMTALEEMRENLANDENAQAEERAVRDLIDEEGRERIRLLRANRRNAAQEDDDDFDDDDYDVDVEYVR